MMSEKGKAQSWLAYVFEEDNEETEKDDLQ